MPIREEGERRAAGRTALARADRWFSQAVAEYIHAQREPTTMAARSRWRLAISGRAFSPRIDLERIRVLQPGQERVPNPPFYADLEKLGFTGLPDFTTMAAITFDDVVVFHDPLTPATHLS